MLRQLRALLDLRDLTIKEGMKKGGASEQLYNQWQHGQSPTLLTIERVVAGLDGNVRLLINPVAHLAVMGEQQVTSETRQIVAILESLPEQARKDLLTTAVQYQRVWGGAANPHEPVEALGQSLARPK